MDSSNDGSDSFDVADRDAWVSFTDFLHEPQDDFLCIPPNVSVDFREHVVSEASKAGIDSVTEADGTIFLDWIRRARRVRRQPKHFDDYQVELPPSLR